MAKENESLQKKRHSLAHLLAAAVLKQYPHAKLAIGPATDTGFYYDIDFSASGDADSRGTNAETRGKSAPGDDDLESIRKNMKKLLNQWSEFTHEEVDADTARERYKDNPYKLELIDEIEEKGEPITLYTAGGGAKSQESEASFTDLCRGGHVENPSKDIDVDAFALTSIAGAYWRGDEKNQMLTRIYGIAFDTKKDLEKHRAQEEEAKARDHRKLGRELDLFTFSDLVGSGLPLYTPKGQLMREAIKDLLWSLSKRRGYQKVEIPHITKLDLYEKSGHAEKFKDEFFYVHGAQSNDEFVMKPMNCPHHTQIFASSPRSYRDLPIRMAEVTHMYRDEKPGQLMGLGRVRSIAIDDAHVFCRRDQIKNESIAIAEIIREFYEQFDLWNKGETFWVSLSVRDPATPEKYLGEEDGWNEAEKYLQEVSDELELDAKRIEGEAAFYGPKLDFMFTDALGRERQLATIQIDFVMPARFELEYTDTDGKKQTPIMIHRAVAGSLERFMAIMIEHYAGAFPLWLSPEQVRVIPVSDAQFAYAQQMHEELIGIDIRSTLDESSESLGKKIRNAKHMKVPYIIVVGDKEVTAKTVTLEGRDGSSNTMTIDEVGNHLLAEIDTKLNPKMENES